ncbi:MAG TPA: carbamoyltransferase HypF, partial [Candidatus Omnitrophica bacterium]|nr:carbamoyltransferase HypF [Candidatus Omnitrophota bacterium]
MLNVFFPCSLQVGRLWLEFCLDSKVYVRSTMDRTRSRTNPTRLRIKIEGKVQGVGFRPTVYRHAIERNLVGWVTNTSTGVIIEAEGEKRKVEDFLIAIKESPPPRAEIVDIQVAEIQQRNEHSFRVLPSISEERAKTRVSPDIATCEECLKELFAPEDRRYLYPFINCTNCGPRFTIIQNIPYDRPNTTMEKFAMCNLCHGEYDAVTNRRFHAQPNACAVCGPELMLIQNAECKMQKLCGGRGAIERTIQLLNMGKIVAIKGLGGFHLACDALNDEAVKTLRSRKYREDKPFALMAKDLRIVKKYCEVSSEEEELLSSFRSPIVLLRKRENVFPPISENVAPNNKYLGFMLPYTPLHYLLFSQLTILVMTSGNISDEPIAYENDEALQRLKGITDYFLLHNRDIYIRCDDSVTRIFHPLHREFIIRRSRGYVPDPIKIENSQPAGLVRKFKIENSVLACGGYSKNTFAIASEDELILSHHIGDMDNIETYNSFVNGIEHFKKLLELEPKIIAHDLHPEYLSTKYAQQIYNRSPGTYYLLPVQHHHAHIASVMADNLLDNRKVIGIAFDGTGLGSDGNLWGGEFLIADYSNFQRIAHLKYIPLPGGEKAIKEPWRIAASYLYCTFGEKFFNFNIDFIRRIDKNKWKILQKMIDEGINTPFTSSVGRLFDAVSSLIGVRDTINYEGQAAIELEMVLDENQKSLSAGVAGKIKNQKYRYKVERR